MKDLLHHAILRPDRSVENCQRAARVLSYVLEHERGVLYMDIRRDMGLSYTQCVIAVGLLVNLEFVTVLTDAVWNGQHYVHPHTVIER